PSADKAADAIDAGMEPGTLRVLEPGQDIRFSDPPGVGDYSDFVKAQLRSIAVGMGATYQQVSGDYADANYSSLRASLVEYRRRVEQIQHHVIVHQLCRPVWTRWLQVEALNGRISAVDLDKNPTAYRADWLPPRWAWVDPQKDVTAELQEIGGGLKSRTQAAAERGVPIEQIDAELAADQARLAALGVTLAAPPTQPVPQTQETADAA
ncbi:MAG: phage portal protein, partial [Rhodospirillaceae bacterium]|nr:phage portal protein [Rhodospirillaceae bacterium]